MKKKKQTMVSLSKFGIDNCNRPRSNKKMYNINSTTRKNKTINKSNINNFILFPSSLGQTRDGVELSPSYIVKHIKRKNIV